MTSYALPAEVQSDEYINTIPVKVNTAATLMLIVVHSRSTAETDSH